MLKDLYRCSPLPWLIVSLVMALIIWIGPFYYSLDSIAEGPLKLSASLQQVMNFFVLLINAFLFRKLVDVTSILKTGERLSLYPFLLLSSLCLIGSSGIIELLAISIQLLFLIRTFNGIAAGSLERSAFDSGLIIAFASLLQPIYGFLLLIFLSIAFIHALLNIRVLLLSVLGFLVPFLIYAQVAYLIDSPLFPAALVRSAGGVHMRKRWGFILILYVLILIGALLYNLYLSFTVMGTGQVRRRMLIRSAFSMVGISIGIGLVSSIFGYGPSPHLAMIPGLSLLCLEFMRDQKIKWEPYLFLSWLLATGVFIWSAS